MNCELEYVGILPFLPFLGLFFSGEIKVCDILRFPSNHVVIEFESNHNFKLVFHLCNFDNYSL